MNGRAVGGCWRGVGGRAGALADRIWRPRATIDVQWSRSWGSNGERQCRCGRSQAEAWQSNRSDSSRSNAHAPGELGVGPKGRQERTLQVPGSDSSPFTTRYEGRPSETWATRTRQQAGGRADVWAGAGWVGLLATSTQVLGWPGTSSTLPALSPSRKWHHWPLRVATPPLPQQHHPHQRPARPRSCRRKLLHSGPPAKPRSQALAAGRPGLRTLGMKDHLRPEGKPAPPRPRSPLCFIWSTIQSGPWGGGARTEER